MKTILLGLCCAWSLAAMAQSAPADPWTSLRFLEGNWTGTAEGESGRGTAHRSYRFILGYRFLEEANVSAYAPKKPDLSGEVHEHRSLLSYDRMRKRLVLRQFHQEGFVNQYVQDPDLGSTGKVVFVSEGFENLSPKWRARETYELISRDAFIETFEIAPPGKEFSVYSRNSFTRAVPR